MPTIKFPAQAETIERVKAILNLSDEALAAEVAVRPETLQKYAAGYQKAGGKLMQIIARLPEMRRRPAAPAPAAPGGRAPVADGDAPGFAALEGPSSEDQLGTVLKEGTLDEVRLLRQVIGTLFRQIQLRREAARASRPRQPRIFEGQPRLLPALGYVPAGWPQAGVEQQPGGRFLVVPADEYPEAEFALKVQGDSMVDADIHHGDWVLMSRRREPREGSVVAALCDNHETTLKTYCQDRDGKPFLRSENHAYPAQIIPDEEMQVQGVMVGKLRMAEEG